MLEIAVRRRQGAFQLEVDLATGAGVTALFGPSGSGKTSLANMVAGLARPDQGRITLDGRPLFDGAARLDLPPERRRIGYVFQEGRLFPHLSVRSNLIFGQRRVPAAERAVPFDDVVAVLGIEALLERRPARLSGGEKQRVAIGRALLTSPRLLLMDEPLAALDAARKAEILPFIAALSRHFATPILYVSHSMDEVLQLADSLVLLQNGQVAAHGPVEELLARPDLAPLTGRGHAGAVLRATVTAHDDAAGVTRLAFAGGPLLVARAPLTPGQSVRVRIAARDVSLALDPPGRVSIQNCLPASVVRVGPAEDGLVDVLLDCGGARLWSQITPLARDRLHLRPGQPLHALIKAATIAAGDIAAKEGAMPCASPSPRRT